MTENSWDCAAQERAELKRDLASLAGLHVGKDGTVQEGANVVFDAAELDALFEVILDKYSLKLLDHTTSCP